MKRIKDLYPRICDKDYIRNIIILASRGKKSRQEVQDVLNDLEFFTERIYWMVVHNQYELAPTRNATITERGKQRQLTISPFYPNRILDYLMVETLKPYIRKSMYEYCIGNVDKRGMMYGKQVIARKYKRYKYYIKLDIRKFYPSVSSALLLDFVRSKIKDEKFLTLCETMILSEKDLPIGSYYSQWFSNWYLQDVDHYIKEVLKIPFYIRYVDDMVLMSNNKRQLRRAMFAINDKLRGKGVELKPNAQVKQTAVSPLDFIGFRFADNIKLRTKNYKRINKRMRAVRKKKHVCASQARSLLSFIGWLKQVKCGYSYYNSKIKPYVRVGTLRKITSMHATLCKNNEVNKYGNVR